MMLNSFYEWEYCFFGMMGKFFSRKEYIKEMGCQFYSNPNMKWYILYENISNIIGFASIEKKDNYYYLDNVYIIKEYRNNGYCKKILNRILEENNDIPIKLICNNEIATKIYENLVFKIYCKNGIYNKMIRRNL